MKTQENMKCQSETMPRRFTIQLDTWVTNTREMVAAVSRLMQRNGHVCTLQSMGDIPVLLVDGYPYRAEFRTVNTGFVGMQTIVLYAVFPAKVS